MENASLISLKKDEFLALETFRMLSSGYNGGAINI